MSSWSDGENVPRWWTGISGTRVGDPFLMSQCWIWYRYKSLTGVGIRDNSLFHSVPCYCYWLLSCSWSKMYYISIPDTSGQAHTYDIWSFMFYLQQNVLKGNYRLFKTKLKSKCKNIWSSQPTFRCVKQDLKPLPVNLPDSWGCVSASMWQ